MNEHCSETTKADILVVDDTKVNLHLLMGLLAGEGYQARPAPNGRLALAAARTAPPDLILLDINMPEMDGYEVCARLKADEQTRDIPIIFISALNEIFDKIKAFAAGGVDYITKPFQVEEVLARVKIHLTLRNLRKQLETQNRLLQQEVAERKRTQAALQEINDELERRVEERTAELIQLNKAYERFVPNEILKFLHKKSILEVNLGDQIQQKMTVLFSDIRSFTSMSEQMTPEDNFKFINGYLSRMSPIIREYQGFIDKYMGDAIMALFPGNPNNALQAAIAMLETLASYNVTLQRLGQLPIHIGIGLHTGMVMLGTVGEAERMEGTVISDAVNLASRLEGLTKLYGASILITESTLFDLDRPYQYQFRFLDKVKVKGKKEPVSVFEILDGEIEESRAMKLKTQSDFEKGLLYYYSQEFTEAALYFNRVWAENRNDKAAHLYLMRINQFLEYGVPVDWDGIEVLTEK
jgi:two-component system sensor histidine kinase ChiS